MQNAENQIAGFLGNSDMPNAGVVIVPQPALVRAMFHHFQQRAHAPALQRINQAAGLLAGAKTCNQQRHFAGLRAFVSPRRGRKRRTIPLPFPRVTLRGANRFLPNGIAEGAVHRARRGAVGFEPDFSLREICDGRLS
jgi:hypothetical protein